MKKYLIILCSLMSCAGDPNTETPPVDEKAENSPLQQIVEFSDEQLKSAGIEVDVPAIENLSGTLRLQGTIDVPPQSTISLSFPLGGYLRSTKMLPGMRVRKGQVLAELEDMQFIQLQQDYLTAKEKLTLAESEFSRQRDLNVSKASSDKILQQAKTEMETQRILTSALAQKLEVIGISPEKLRADNISRSVSIVSPINGFVSKVNVNVGKYTSPTDMLFELVDPRDIHLALNVFEKDLNSLAIGQKVAAYTNNEPDKKFHAEIILISKNLDLDRMAEVHCHFDRYDASLVPGMYLNGDVAINNNKGLTVPEEAVVRWDNKYYVFAEKSRGKFEMVEIEAGLITGRKQQIGGASVNEQTRIVVKNAYALLMKIKNTEEEE
jgi:cobalt-zinc-cadmium efflux system membrane fusion protein